MTRTSYPLINGGTTLNLTVTDGALPVVRHWGPAVTDHDLGEALTPPFVSDQTDELIQCSLLPEEARGWLGEPGLRGHRDGADSTHRFVVDAVTTSPQGGTTPTAATFMATSPGLALELRVAVTEEGIVELDAALTNTGATPYTLDGLLLGLRTPPGADEVLDFAGRHLRERSPQRHPLHQGTIRRDNRRGRTSLQSTMLMIAGEPGFGFRAGRVHGVHVAWSGNHTHLAERAHGGERILAGGELLLPGEVVLAPGDGYATPTLLFSHGTGLDELSARYHAWLRRVAGPKRPRPVTLNMWEAVYFDHRFEPIAELAEKAARVGVERFVVDDGWFGSRRDDTSGLGDWTVSPEVWPDGLEPLADRVRELGMEFGLWVEPEMISLDSELAREHPDWILRPVDRLPVAARHQHVLNLAHPAAWTHLAGRLGDLVERLGITYLKWDHNRDLHEACGPRGERLVRAQTLAVYRLLDHLKERFPALEIESCSSGGGRVDLGILRRTDRVWASDCNDALERQDIQRWTGLLLPPEYVGAHIGPPRSHTTGRTHDLSFRAGTALFGHLGIEWDLRSGTEAELDAVASWVRRGKEIRDLLAGGRTVRTEDRDGTRVHGVVTGDRAVFAVVQLKTSRDYPTAPVRLPGLDADARWGVRIDPLTPQPELPWTTAPVALTGRALAEVGLAVPTLHPESLVLIHFERITT